MWAVRSGKRGRKEASNGAISSGENTQQQRGWGAQAACCVRRGGQPLRPAAHEMRGLCAGAKRSAVSMHWGRGGGGSCRMAAAGCSGQGAGMQCRSCRSLQLTLQSLRERGRECGPSDYRGEGPMAMPQLPTHTAPKLQVVHALSCMPPRPKAGQRTATATNRCASPAAARSTQRPAR